MIAAHATTRAHGRRIVAALLAAGAPEAAVAGDAAPEQATGPPAPLDLDRVDLLHRRADTGVIVSAAGGSVGFVIAYAGAIDHLSCALDDSCLTPESDLLMGVGMSLSAGAIAAGGGLFGHGALRAAQLLTVAGHDAPIAVAATSLAFDGAALGLLGGAAYVAATSDDLWDGVTVLALTTGGVACWATGTGLAARHLRRTGRRVDALRPGPAVQVGPWVDPGTLTVGVSGVW